ncbi:nitrate/nitrite transporter [Egicoccus sp. AB-alg2]|uniref:MFS transporter n=1 Tax=Egicoccus sp. AB-alg2 TaxID=3242693 RepID=UPI00359CFDD1
MTAAPAQTVDPPGRWGALAILGTAELLAMSTWFSASAVVTDVQELWQLTPAAASMLTIAVQLGFVVGAVVSAALSLADVFLPRRVVAVAAVGAALANLGLLAVGSAGPAIALRFLTGVFLAGVYPPAMKAMATWFRRQRGLALGVMVGALTLGSALPHLVRAVGGLDWRVVVTATSATTLVGAVLALVARDGPYPFPRARFDPRLALRVLADRDVRLASYGYFGHMWELYAMWAWVAVYLTASFELSGLRRPETAASLAAFAAIGIGALGCVAGGVLGDRRGRAWLTSLAMLASGGAAAAAGVVFGGPPALVVGLVLFWGFWVVADSAQFSTLVTELADQRYVGTAVTLQLALGFTLTVATIWLIPVLVDAAGWRWAFLVLTPGPLLGTAAMRALARRQRAGSPALAG